MHYLAVGALQTPDFNSAAVCDCGEPGRRKEVRPLVLVTSIRPQSVTAENPSTYSSSASSSTHFNSAAVCDCGELAVARPRVVGLATSIRPQSVTAENLTGPEILRRVERDTSIRPQSVTAENLTTALTRVPSWRLQFGRSL